MSDTSTSTSTSTATSTSTSADTTTGTDTTTFNFVQCLDEVAECDSPSLYPIGNACVEVTAGSYMGTGSNAQWRLVESNPGLEVAEVKNIGIETCIISAENEASGTIESIRYESATGTCYLERLPTTEGEVELAREQVRQARARAAARLAAIRAADYESFSLGTSDPNVTQCTYARFDPKTQRRAKVGPTPAEYVTVVGPATYTFKNDLSDISNSTEALILTNNSGVLCREAVASTPLDQNTYGDLLQAMGAYCKRSDNVDKAVCTSFCVSSPYGGTYCDPYIPMRLIASVVTAVVLLIVFILVYVYAPASASKIVLAVGITLLLGCAGWAGYEVYKYAADNFTNGGTEPDAVPTIYPGGEVLTAACNSLTVCSGLTKCTQVRPGLPTCLWCFPNFASGDLSGSHLVLKRDECSGVEAYAADNGNVCLINDCAQTEYPEPISGTCITFQNSDHADLSYLRKVFVFVRNSTPSNFSVNYNSPSGSTGFTSLQAFSQQPSIVYEAADITLTDQATGGVFFVNVSVPNTTSDPTFAFTAATPESFDFPITGDAYLVDRQHAYVEIRMTPRPPAAAVPPAALRESWARVVKTLPTPSASARAAAPVTRVGCGCGSAKRTPK